MTQIRMQGLSPRSRRQTSSFMRRLPRGARSGRAVLAGYSPRRRGRSPRARRFRDVSASSSARSAATVESRSSQKVIGRSVRPARLRAKARVDCARGPSLPSMLRGRPSTSPPIRRAEARVSRVAASAANFVRRTVCSGEAMRRLVSETATPMVRVPRSRPISARPGASAATKAATSGWIAAVIGG